MTVWSRKYLSLINHVVFVLDASGSMRRHRAALLRVMKDQTAQLARRSEETGQETRISVYLFDDVAQCVIFDMDVLRAPDLSDIYSVGGTTALIDATSLALDELARTATLHGDHAFLAYVLTDGGENASRRVTATSLSHRLASDARLGNWTFACFVPGDEEARDAARFGFPAPNIIKWDTNSTDGMDSVGVTMASATDTFFTGRAAGTRSFQGGALFSTGAEAVNVQTVAAAGLTPLDPKTYAMLPVRERQQTRPFVMENGLVYVNGTVFYLFMKTEHIQPGKQLLVVRKSTNEVYAGPEARSLIGLPSDITIKGKPTLNPDFDIFVQSTAPNRNLIPNTVCIVLNPVKAQGGVLSR
jgi:uncharacterized protein YegL